MSRNNPFNDLASVFEAMETMTSRSAKQQDLTRQLNDLSRQLHRAAQMNAEAARLLRDGPSGFGGPEKWMTARNKWLEKFNA